MSLSLSSSPEELDSQPEPSSDPDSATGCDAGRAVEPGTGGNSKGDPDADEVEGTWANGTDVETEDDIGAVEIDTATTRWMILESGSAGLAPLASALP